MRPIDADDLITAFPADEEPTVTKASIRATIRHMPTLDIAPVVHAHWILNDPDEDWYHCSNCGEDIEWCWRGNPNKRYRYCFCCGAVMSEEIEDE